MKIGIVFDDSLDKPDGVQQYILSLGPWLIAQGHEVHYLVGQTNRTDIANTHSLSKNIKVTFNGNQLSIPLPTSKRRLKALLAQEQFDVLHVQVPYSPWLAHRLIMAAPANTRIVGTFHIVAFSRIVTLATKVLARWTKSSLRRFDEIVSVSSAAVSFAKATYGIDTTVVPNVFDWHRFNSARPMFPKLNKAVRILFLGRLVERKGCMDLLKAIKLLKQRGVNTFEVTICGRGPQLDQLQAYAKEHALPVSFSGFVSEFDKPGYYAAADISVFPSTGGESFGIVLVEALASGKSAVLAARNSGYMSVLSDRPAQLFNTRDPEDLADHISHLLTNRADRLAHQSWGETYSRTFDVNVVGPQIIKLYGRS